MTLLIRHARILTMDDAFTEYTRADILVEGSKIVQIGENLPMTGDRDGLRVIDGSGKLAMPGLVNGHIHSPGNFMKGALDDYPLEIFMLYEVPPLSDTPPDFRMNYVRTMLGNIEMLKLGITSVHDDAFHVPVPTAESIDGLMKSYVDSGMRAVVTIDQPNVIEYDKYPFLYDLLPDDIRASMAQAPRMSTKELLDCYQYQIRNWHNAENGRVRSGV
jgi:5-methylthioadenosine/S-adenosylhomocysteine deaminase